MHSIPTERILQFPVLRRLFAVEFRGARLGNTQGSHRYMHAEGELVARGKFIAHLQQCLADRAGFCTDINSFLRRDLTYGPDVAGAIIERDLLGLLPERWPQ